MQVAEGGEVDIAIDAPVDVILLNAPTPIVCLERHIGYGDVEIVDDYDTADRPVLWSSIAIGLATFVLGLGFGLAALSTAPILLGYHPVALASGSMEPALRAGDVVVVNPNADVALGSIIDYRTESGTRMHRVIEVVDDGFRTKGDSNQSPDQHLVTSDDLRGVGVFVVPFVGLPRHWFEEGQWLPLALTVFVFSTSSLVLRQSGRRLQLDFVDDRLPA